MHMLDHMCITVKAKQPIQRPKLELYQSSKSAKCFHDENGLWRERIKSKLNVSLISTLSIWHSEFNLFHDENGLLGLLFLGRENEREREREEWDGARRGKERVKFDDSCLPALRLERESRKRKCKIRAAIFVSIWARASECRGEREGEGWKRVNGLILISALK